MFDKLWRCSFTVDDELNALRNKVEHLAALESDNSNLVEYGEIQPGKKRKREVDLWFTKVKHIKSAHEHIETECKEKGPSNDLKSKFENLTNEVDGLIQRGAFSKGVVIDDHASTRVPLVITKLVGQSCSENIASILSWLKQDGVFAIGVYGMGGVGKTELIKHVHNKLLGDSEIKGQVYMVTASQECSLQKLQIDISKAIGVHDPSQYNDERIKAILLERFTKLGKSVLIMDDLWQHYLTEAIGVPLETGRCKIVTTSRSLDVCYRMQCREIIKLEPLCRPDALKLFTDILGVEKVPGELNEVAKEIVAECGGLPLALKTMGVCMREIDNVHEWQNALFELRKPEISQDAMEDGVFRVLKYSYNNLKDETTKHCFLNCVLFGEDEIIGRNSLVTLWRNEGLLDDAECEQDKAIRGQAILDRLVRSCLLESVAGYHEHCVKMHDLIRDMAIIITHDSPRFMAKSGINLEEVPEMESWSEDLLKVSLSRNRIRQIPNNLAPITNISDFERIMWIIGAVFSEDEIASQLRLVNIDELVIEKSEMKGRRGLGDLFPSLGKTNVTRILIRKCRGFKYIMPRLQPDTSMLAPLDTLEHLTLEELPDFERIVEYEGCSFSKLVDLQISNCPKLKVVFPISLINLPLSLPNLRFFTVSDCKEVEQIFESNNATPPNPIRVLWKLDLINLPKLENTYKGVLFSTFSIVIKKCPKLNVLKGEKVICDASSSTLASIKSEHAKGWWKNLYQDHPQAAASLSRLIEEHDSNSGKNERDDESTWAAFLSLSSLSLSLSLSFPV